MSDVLSPSEILVHEDEEIFVPRDLADGVDEDAIVAKLERLDWDASAARAYVRQFQLELYRWRNSPAERRRLVAQYRRQMVLGASLLLATPLLLVLCVLLNGAFIDVVLGLGGFGLFLTSVGFSRWWRYRRLPPVETL